MTPIVLQHGLFGFADIKVGKLKFSYFHGIDRAILERGHPVFISRVLASVARAQTDAEISRKVDELFSDPEVAREQVETARTFRRSAPTAGAGW